MAGRRTAGQRHHRPAAVIRPWLVPLLGVGLLLAGCSGAGQTVRTGGDGPSTEPPPAATPTPGAPPPVTVIGESVLELRPWTYCWSSGSAGICADGSPPAEPPSVGSAEEVRVRFPVPGWRFEAIFVRAGAGACSRTQRVPLTPLDDSSFLLRQHGRAADYDVTLSGRGPAGAGGGDLVVTFRWQVTRGGPLAEPTAQVSALAAGGTGGTGSYGVTLEVENLAATPGRSSAEVEIIPTGGPSTVLPLAARADGCSPEGTLRFGGSPGSAAAAAGLGGPPYRYVVSLVLDGRTHVAEAIWPNDVDERCAPCVPLRFEPPLPRLT